MAAEKLHTWLADQDVPYQSHVHERVVSAQRLAATEDVSGWDVAKPVLLSIGDQLAMMVMPAAVQVDLDKASLALGGNPVRLASEAEFTATFPDCEPGAEPPFGNLYGVPVFLDERLYARDRLVCRDGSHTASVELTVNDYVRVVGPEIVDVAGAPG